MKLLSISDLMRLKGIRYSRSQIYRLMKADKFPLTVKLGDNCVALIEEEVDAWLEEKVRARDSAQESEQEERDPE